MDIEELPVIIRNGQAIFALLEIEIGRILPFGDGRL